MMLMTFRVQERRDVYLLRFNKGHNLYWEEELKVINKGNLLPKNSIKRTEKMKKKAQMMMERREMKLRGVVMKMKKSKREESMIVIGTKSRSYRSSRKSS